MILKTHVLREIDKNFSQLSAQYALVLAQMDQIDWKAGAHLAKRIRTGDFSPTDVVFILTDDVQLVGFVALTKTDIARAPNNYGPFLSTMYVNPEFRKQGFSKQLIELVLTEARAQKIPKLYIMTQHIGLYERYGFIQIDEIPDIHNRQMRVLQKILTAEN
ncbi:MAG: GNAT family N-acetyltransferase [Arcanobacterium sp.]|nr:GNAT family N-acetyltransferase [Arcanobacterium sp.]